MENDEGLVGILIIGRSIRWLDLHLALGEKNLLDSGGAGGSLGHLYEHTRHDEHTVELAKIAAYLHDIGNLVNRVEHSQSGAVMAFRILDNLGMPPKDIA
ncbi:MAG: HD domain-containing protein, partial [Clostridia bacterium]|nr:HD domain-containing protein [Clostridia bacterium]